MIDKILHIAVCYAICFTLCIVGREDVAFFSTIGIGLIKECHDKYIKKTIFDVFDLICDVIGCTIAIITYGIVK